MTFKKMDKANWDAVMHANLDSSFNMTAANTCIDWRKGEMT
jgi:hypothetical protein